MNKNKHLRIKHISDMHGQFPELTGWYDIIVDTGDSHPNSYAAFSTPPLEAEFQEDWVKDNLPRYVDWIGDKPYIFCSGNHSFISGPKFERLLKSAGIDAHCIDTESYIYQGYHFYGFPYINSINGTWNYETPASRMDELTTSLIKLMNDQYVDVLCCHATFNGVFAPEHYGTDWGNLILRDKFDNNLSKDMKPFAVLSGHLHSNHGITVKDGVLYSNAARTQHIIDIP